MATQENTSSTSKLNNLSSQVNAIAAHLAGMEATLHIFRESEGCTIPLNNALYLLAESCETMNAKLCTIADQMTEGGAA